MVEESGAAPDAEIKVRAVVTICDGAEAPRRALANALACQAAEQDEIDRIFGQRGLVRGK